MDWCIGIYTLILFTAIPLLEFHGTVFSPSMAKQLKNITKATLRFNKLVYLQK